jgi:gas vesicle protein
MSNINREYIKTLSKIVEKIKRLQEQLKDVSDIEKNLSFKNVVNSLEEFRKNIDVLKIVIDEELRTKTLKVENSLVNLEKNIFDNITALKKEVEEIKFIWEKDKELGHKIQKSISEVIKEIKEELDNLKEKLKNYAEELRFTKEGLLKSPGIIGPSASGIEVLLNNTKKGVYSKLNFIEGDNITLNFSENKPEGKVNLTINSTGGGGGEEGAKTFLQLTDTPSSYFTHGNELVKVNSSEDALQFVKIASLINPGRGISIEGSEFITINNDGVFSVNGINHEVIFEGNPNQINVETLISSSKILLSTPQDIHTEAIPTFAGLILGKPYENTGEIRFLELEENGSNYVGFKAPDNIENNVIWTLPNSDGTNGQVLTTNGNGVLSWKTISGGVQDAIIYAIALG